MAVTLKLCASCCIWTLSSHYGYGPSLPGLALIRDTTLDHPQTTTPEVLAIRRVPLERLHLDTSNARLHDERNLASIRASLKRFGQAEPLVVQRESGRVIGGNGRLEAMRELGWTEADVVELDLDEVQATALAIALNRTAELAEWDPSILGKLLDSLRAEDALDGIGFESDEIDEILAGLIEEDPQDIDDPGPEEPPDSPVTREGDLWVLGGHKILSGDSTNAEHVARLMGEEKAQLLATDPPYLVDYDGTNHPAEHHKKAGRKDPDKPGSTVGNRRWDEYVDPESSVTFFSAWLRVALEHCIERVPVYQWHASRRSALVEQAWEQNGLLLHQQIIWAKPRGVLTRSLYLWAHEPCHFGWRVGMMPEKSRRPETSATSVWEISQKDQPTGLHPTIKPLEIFERPIAYHSRPGEIVLEPFSGSGTQIIAAERLNRRCRAMEVSAAYVDVAIRRWEQATGKQAVLEATGQTFEELAKERETA